ncbi:MAG: ADP-heptose synthase, partial [Actinomycetota bacterium]
FHAARCRVLLLKLGERGLLTYTSPGDTQSEYFFHLDSMSRNVVDAVGAGDALLAYASLSLKVTDSPVQAAILGSLAAAHECEVDGNVPVSNRDLFVRLDQLEREVNFTP